MTDRTKEEWLRILKESHVEADDFYERETSNLAYLAGAIFGINTYDDEMDHLMAGKAIEVCRAISGKATFEYIKDAADYQWYLMMCHLPFFADRIDWGGSIRGAWWDSYGGVELRSCCLLFDGGSQINDVNFTESGWEDFISAVISYGEQSGAA